MTQRKNFDWVDTIRVFSTLIVIIFHYACAIIENPYLQNVIENFIFGINHFGVAAFFGISGYLVVNSLDHSKNIRDFYRRKMIRIVFPFAILDIIAVIFSNSVHFLSLGTIVGIFPFDMNITKFFNIPHVFRVGEWFIGTIVLLYLVAPLIYKCLRRSVPLTMLGVILIACFSANFFLPLQDQEKIFNIQTLVLVRMPEFVIGMILFLYRDKIFSKASQILALLLTFAMIFYTAFSNLPSNNIWFKYFFGVATDLHFILALMLSIYLSFIVADLANKHFKKTMAFFNGFKDISYTVILVHHIIINKIVAFFGANNLNPFSAVMVLFLILFVIWIVSTIVRKILAPIEKELLS